MFELDESSKPVDVRLTNVLSTDSLASRQPRRVKVNGIKTEDLVLGPTGQAVTWLGEYGINIPGVGGGTATVETEILEPFADRARNEAFDLREVLVTITADRGGFGLSAHVVVPATAKFASRKASA